PAYKLDVNGTAHVAGNIIMESGDLQVNSNARRTLYPWGSLVPTNLNFQVRSAGTGTLELNTDNGGNIQMVTGGGKVGIGTAAPSEKLEVSGRIKDVTGYVAPVGTITMFAGSTAPAGWLMCDGQGLSTGSYADLFAVISYTYGGSGGTFNVPDMRGRNPVGKADSGTFASLNASGGEVNHTLSVAEMPAHQHTGTTSTNGDHNHGFSDYYFAENNGANWGWEGSKSGSDSDNHGYVYYHTTDNSGNHSHTFTTDAAGSSSAHNVLDPYRVVNFIIKY
ncbi:hypothetical protein EB093_08940, partial [bacterium]|nr:hypothetical protein [bacterium]